MLEGFVLAVGVATAGVPHGEVDTLAGRRLVVPDDFTTHATVLVIGFSKRSQSRTTAWSARLANDFGAEPRLGRYSAAALEDVPGFVRGMVVGAMRRGMPAEAQASFLLLFHDVKRWKDLAAYEQPEDAYVLLLDAAHHVVAQTRGSPETAYEPFAAKVRDALNAP